MTAFKQDLMFPLFSFSPFRLEGLCSQQFILFSNTLAMVQLISRTAETRVLTKKRSLDSYAPVDEGPQWPRNVHKKRHYKKLTEERPVTTAITDEKATVNSTNIVSYEDLSTLSDTIDTTDPYNQIQRRVSMVHNTPFRPLSQQAAFSTENNFRFPPNFPTGGIYYLLNKRAFTTEESIRRFRPGSSVNSSAIVAAALLASGLAPSRQP
jgi:hypothetical protein